MTPEGVVKNSIKKLLKTKYPDALVYMPPGGRFGRAGVSDFIILWRGYFIAIEAKAPKGVVSELQKLYLNQVVKAGGYATVAYCADDVERVFEQLRGL